MVAKLIAIGNSRGVRIPKTLIQQAGLTDEVELEVRGDRLTIRSSRQPRSGWETAFQTMRKRAHDKLLDGRSASSSTAWEETEWRW
jgi:antitoxin MazE